MKMLKLSLLSAVLFASVSSFAQGTINFSTKITGSVDAKIFDVDGVTAASGANGFLAQLYVGATADTLVAQGSPVALRSDGGVGYVVASVLNTTLPGGSTAFVKLYAWSGGSSYETATVSRGMSATATQIVLGNPSASPATTPASLTGLQGLTVVPVPEPATLALAGIGGLGLLAMRRKQA